MEERFFFSPVVQRCLVVAAKDLSLPPASMVKVSDLVESFLTSMAVAFKPESPAQTLSFSDVERCLRSLFSSDALSEAEKEGAAALSAYVSAGTQVGRERAELQAELEDFTIIGDSMAESEFLSDERETELPITAALIQQRLIGSGVLSEKAPDKSAAIYIAGVLEFVVTKWLSFAARSARSRGDLELLEADLVHALHTDMQTTLLPFLTRALQQATPSSSVMSVSLLQAEDPPSNDNAPSFILEGPSDAVLRQRSSMSTFVVDEYEPSSPLLATRTPTPPSPTPPPLDAADTVEETPPPPPTPPLPEAPQTTTTVPPPSPKESKRHTDRMWLLALAALITVIAYSLISQLLPTRLQG